MQKLDLAFGNLFWVTLPAKKRYINRADSWYVARQKLRYAACISNSRLKFGHFCKHGLRNFLHTCLFLLKFLFFANLLHFQCINIGKTKKDWTNWPWQFGYTSAAQWQSFTLNCNRFQLKSSERSQPEGWQRYLNLFSTYHPASQNNRNFLLLWIGLNSVK